jgi:hypothetical protein
VSQLTAGGGAAGPPEPVEEGARPGLGIDLAVQRRDQRAMAAYPLPVGHAQRPVELLGDQDQAIAQRRDQTDIREPVEPREHALVVAVSTHWRSLA